MTLYNKTATIKIFHTAGIGQYQQISNGSATSRPTLNQIQWGNYMKDFFAQKPDNQISFNDENLSVILYKKEQLKLFEECAIK
ncbi:hypothetical protein EB796_017483 [Bugula neritina]|uniref:Uncharacterized protein n=1 Tax=Bugula neritina TaxID=10212 RepID=A0A7J7JDD7_BUGNE|nr:hypothetical protein EB796_017483 [Bugula neritina]